jgi:hypothetical protein
MDRLLATQDIELVILHRGHQIKRPAQGGRVLLGYRKRWNARRLFTVLHNTPRLFSVVSIASRNS